MIRPSCLDIKKIEQIQTNSFCVKAVLDRDGSTSSDIYFGIYLNYDSYLNSELKIGYSFLLLFSTALTLSLLMTSIM